MLHWLPQKNKKTIYPYEMNDNPEENWLKLQGKQNF